MVPCTCHLHIVMTGNRLTIRKTGSPEALPWLPNLAVLIRPTCVMCYWVILGKFCYGVRVHVVAYSYILIAIPISYKR